MRLWQTAQSLFVHAPAKLNLFLEVHGQRPDGFHELETLMVAIGIFDTLRFEEEESNESRLRLFDAGERLTGPNNRGTAIPSGSDNLILRAVAALQEFTGIDRRVRITAWKRIPAEAGMAGGSSDAAATLLALNRLWKAGLGEAELLQIGATLGSDVNFFLAGAAAAVCRGRGESIEPISLPTSLCFVVVRPFSGLSTAAVFRRWKPHGPKQTVEPVLKALQAGTPSRIRNLLHNALQRPAEVMNPDIATLRNRFNESPFAGHLMTGSGTAYFGLCANWRLARRLAARFRAMRLGRVFAARSVA